MQFVTKYNLGPFVKPFLGHRGPFYYHFVVVLIGLFPWSVFLGPTIVNAWRAIRARGKDLPSYVFLVCWIGVFFGFWSLCSTKLPHYVLPAYPALAILTGCFLQAWIERAEAAARHIMPIATSIFLGVGVAMLAVLPLGDRAVRPRRADRGASRAGAGRGRRLELVLPGPRPAAVVHGGLRHGLGALHRDALRLGGGPHRPASALPAADGGGPPRQSRRAADRRLQVLRRQHGLLCPRPGGGMQRCGQTSRFPRSLAASLRGHDRR